MKILHGIPASSGLSIGSAHVLHPSPKVDITSQRLVDAAVETERLARAIQQAIARMDTLQRAASGTTADILAAQREMLDDLELKQGAQAAWDSNTTPDSTSMPGGCASRHLRTTGE